MYSSTLSSTFAMVRGQRHAPVALPPVKMRYPLYRRLCGPAGPVWTSADNLATTGIRSLDLPPYSESLYRLNYRGPYPCSVEMKCVGHCKTKYKYCRRCVVQHVRNVMTHAQKPDLVFQRKGRVYLNRRGCQFSRLLATEVCGSADSDCIDRVPMYSARLLASHYIRIFPLRFPFRVSPCAIRFQTRYTLEWPYGLGVHMCL